MQGLGQGGGEEVKVTDDRQSRWTRREAESGGLLGGFVEEGFDQDGGEVADDQADEAVLEISHGAHGFQQV